MTEFETASLIVRGVVGAGQIIVVAIGVHFMRQMNKDRAPQTEAQMEAQRRQVEAQRAEADQREKRADQRHAEAMRALDALVKGMDQQGETLRAAVKGMEAVIERTAPGQSGKGDTP